MPQNNRFQTYKKVDGVNSIRVRVVGIQGPPGMSSVADSLVSKEFTWSSYRISQAIRDYVSSIMSQSMYTYAFGDTVEQGQWVMVSPGNYERTFNHNLATFNITSILVTDNTNTEVIVGKQLVDANNVKLLATVPFSGKISLSYLPASLPSVAPAEFKSFGNTVTDWTQVVGGFQMTFVHNLGTTNITSIFVTDSSGLEVDVVEQIVDQNTVTITSASMFAGRIAVSMQ